MSVHDYASELLGSESRARLELERALHEATTDACRVVWRTILADFDRGIHEAQAIADVLAAGMWSGPLRDVINARAEELASTKKAYDGLLDGLLSDIVDKGPNGMRFH